MDVSDNDKQEFVGLEVVDGEGGGVGVMLDVGDANTTDEDAPLGLGMDVVEEDEVSGIFESSFTKAVGKAMAC